MAITFVYVENITDSYVGMLIYSLAHSIMFNEHLLYAIHWGT